MQSASKFILTTEAHKLQMIGRVRLFFCVADLAEEWNSWIWGSRVHGGAETPEKQPYKW